MKILISKVGDNACTKLIVCDNKNTIISVRYGNEVPKNKHAQSLRVLNEFMEKYAPYLNETQLRLVTEARVTCEYLSREFCTIIQGPSLARELREL